MLEVTINCPDHADPAGRVHRSRATPGASGGRTEYISTRACHPRSPAGSPDDASCSCPCHSGARLYR